MCGCILPVVVDALGEVQVEQALSAPVPEGVAVVVGLRVRFPLPGEGQGDVGLLRLVCGVDGVVCSAAHLGELLVGGRVDLGAVEHATIVSHLDEHRLLSLCDIT